MYHLDVNNHSSTMLLVSSVSFQCDCSMMSCISVLTQPRFKENPQFDSMLRMHKETLERFGVDKKYDY